MKRNVHPFARRDNQFKYVYCFGLGVMSMGHMKAITETQDYFNEVLEWIQLPQMQRQKILIDINNHFERRVDEVFSTIRNKEDQYCFIMDLYRILNLTSWGNEYCSQVLEEYLQVFQFSAIERIFFQEFSNAAYDRDLERGRKACLCFSEEGYTIRYDFLTWFFPDFFMEEEFDGFTISAGKTVILDKPSVVRGDIIVERGGSLLIQGAVLKMEGCIRVQGGRLKMDHGEIQVLACSAPYWLMLKDTAVVTIVDTVIDCQGRCGVLTQNTGRLIVEDSWFRRTAGACALVFSGQNVKLLHSRFHQGKSGLVEIKGAAQAKIEKCDFKAGEAEYGGGIYSESIGDVAILQCTFSECKAKYLGSAVYFKYQRLGQSLENCVCQDCIPKESSFFNVLY